MKEGWVEEGERRGALTVQLFFVLASFFSSPPHLKFSRLSFKPHCAPTLGKRERDREGERASYEYVSRRHMAAAALGLGVSRRVECCRCIIPPIQITTIRIATVEKKKKRKTRCWSSPPSAGTRTADSGSRRWR